MVLTQWGQGQQCAVTQLFQQQSTISLFVLAAAAAGGAEIMILGVLGCMTLLVVRCGVGWWWVVW